MKNSLLFFKKALDSLTKFKKEFKNDHNFLYGTTKGYFKNLKDQIENCRSKKVNVFLFGWKKSGKSSIIKLLCNLDEKDIKSGFNEETITIQPYEFEDVRFIDTIGLTRKKFKKCFDKLSGALKIYPPDLVIWVVNAHDWVGHKESLIGVQKNFLDLLEDHKNPHVMVLLTKVDQVLTDIDPENFNDKNDYFKAVRDEGLKQFCNEKEIFNLLRGYGNVVYDIVVAKNNGYKYNLEIISDFIREKYQSYMENHLICRLQEVGTQVVIACTSIITAISVLPFVDIPIGIIITNFMIDMIACISINPNKTAKTYKRGVTGIGVLVANIARFTALGVSVLLEATLVGAIVGTPLSMLANGLATGIIGGTCITYFLELN